MLLAKPLLALREVSIALIILSAYWGLHAGGQRDLKSVSFDGSWVEFKCIGQDLVDILTLLSALNHWWNI